jgi:hypothetical protein
LLDAKKCMEIYEFCQQQYSKSRKKKGYYSLIQDKTVIELAVKEFKMSEIVIIKAFDLASQSIVKKE